MHPYQVDQAIRTRVFLVSGALAIFAGWLWSLLVGHLPFTLPWWVETPSVLGFFGLFVWLFDNYLWKTRLAQQWGLFCIRNLNGTWTAEIKSSQSGFADHLAARAKIRQTATKICVSLDFDNSTSDSVTANLVLTERLH